VPAMAAVDPSLASPTSLALSDPRSHRTIGAIHAALALTLQARTTLSWTSLRQIN